jgi:serine/threonine protein kinase
MQQRFHTYDLITEIKQDATSTTYLASPSEHPEQKVILQLFKASAFSRAKEKDQFLATIAKLKQLQYPSLVPMLDAGIEGDQAYIVSEYYPGGSLRVRLDRDYPKRLPQAQAIDLLVQIGNALDYLHTHRVVHGHLTPEHILFDAHGRAALADPSIIGNISQDLDEQPDAAYTFRYLAPEQFLAPGDALSDQYALCCIAYELFTGQVPFAHPDVHQVMRMQQKEIPAPLSSQVSDLPDIIEAIVLTGLEKNPLLRHPNLAAFVSALQPAPSYELPLPRGKRRTTGPTRPRTTAPLTPTQRPASNPGIAQPPEETAAQSPAAPVSKTERAQPTWRTPVPPPSIPIPPSAKIPESFSELLEIITPPTIDKKPETASSSASHAEIAAPISAVETPQGDPIAQTTRPLPVIQDNGTGATPIDASELPTDPALITTSADASISGENAQAGKTPAFTLSSPEGGKAIESEQPIVPTGDEKTLDMLLEDMSHLEELFLVNSGKNALAEEKTEEQKPAPTPLENETALLAVKKENTPPQVNRGNTPPPPISSPGLFNASWHQSTGANQLFPLTPIPLPPPAGQVISRFAPLPARPITPPRRTRKIKTRPLFLLIASLLVVTAIAGGYFLLTSGSTLSGVHAPAAATSAAMTETTANGTSIAQMAGTPNAPGTVQGSQVPGHGSTVTPAPTQHPSPGATAGASTPTPMPPGSTPAPPAATPTPFPPVAISEGVNYELVNRNSGQVMEVTGGSINIGATLDQSPYSGNTSQIWHFFNAGNGYYELVNQHSHKSLAETGQQINQVSLDRGGDSTQEWLVTSTGGGYFTLTNAASGNVLDVSQSSTNSQAPIVQSPNRGGASQQWTLIPAS